MLKNAIPAVKVFACLLGSLFVIYLNVELATFTFAYLPMAVCSLVGLGVLLNSIIEEFRNEN